MSCNDCFCKSSSSCFAFSFCVFIPGILETVSDNIELLLEVLERPGISDEVVDNNDKVVCVVDNELKTIHNKLKKQYESNQT